MFIIDPEFRRTAHKVLDEWLDYSIDLGYQGVEVDLGNATGGAQKMFPSRVYQAVKDCNGAARISSNKAKSADEWREARDVTGRRASDGGESGGGAQEVRELQANDGARAVREAPATGAAGKVRGKKDSRAV